MYSFGILGADKRMKALEQSLKRDGYPARMLGNADSFDGLSVIVLPPGCDYIGIADKCRGKTVLAPINAAGCVNYLEMDSFKRENAVPTAEGAIYTLMGMTEHTVCGMDIAVVGYGCIGKALLRMLSGLGARVTVYARGESPRTKPIACLAGSTHTVIFNTVPAMVIDYDMLRSFPQRPIIIDLASRPGGVDFAAAELFGIRCVQELGIPGRYSPATAGEVLKNAVISYLRGVK
ncbi:MAG: hypothetical protein IJ408_01530 [Clostridia bacterium]|nr:hypothetical protein [Clostridia bacterium]